MTLTSRSDPWRCAGRYNRFPASLARYGIADWDEKCGNHRAVVRVGRRCPAVFAYLPWRRRDPLPSTKAVRVVDAGTGKPIANSVTVECNAEYGEIVFEPVSGPGLHQIYCLVPAADSNAFEWPRSAFPVTRYMPPRQTASAKWLAGLGLDDASCQTIPSVSAALREGRLDGELREHGVAQELGPWNILPPAAQVCPYPAKWRDLPEAELVEFQARGAWHSFYPMEVPATLDEMLALRKRTGNRPFLLFPERRENPIRMTDALPFAWAMKPASGLDAFEAEARPGEYLVFQIGVYAKDRVLANIRADWTALTGPGGHSLPTKAITCFNLGGIDQRGRTFRKRLHLERDRVQPLWFGIDLPADARPGECLGSVRMAADRLAPQSVRLRLRVAGTPPADRGDSEHWRLSRLRWLNSRLSLDTQTCAPYLPVRRRGTTIEILGGTIEFGRNGMVRQVMSHIDMFDITPRGRPVLAGPVRLLIPVRRDVARLALGLTRSDLAEAARPLLRRRASDFSVAWLGDYNAALGLRGRGRADHTGLPGRHRAGPARRGPSRTRPRLDHRDKAGAGPCRPR